MYGVSEHGLFAGAVVCYALAAGYGAFLWRRFFAGRLVVLRAGGIKLVPHTGRCWGGFFAATLSGDESVRGGDVSSGDGGGYGDGGPVASVRLLSVCGALAGGGGRVRSAAAAG
jgi:hypothetical protein